MQSRPTSRDKLCCDNELLVAFMNIIGVLLNTSVATIPYVNEPPKKTIIRLGFPFCMIIAQSL